MFSAKMPIKNKSLGINNGHMSKAFREFNFGEIGPGEWAGEESVWSNFPVSYSLKAKTDVVVLEMTCSDLRHILTP